MTASTEVAAPTLYFCNTLEDIYLKEYATVPALTAGLEDYFHLYNYERPHQSLQDLTPAVVYQKGLPAID